MAEIEWNEPALDALLDAVSAAVLGDLSRDVAAMARTLAPVRTRHGPPPPGVRHPHYGRGGALKASVVAWEGQDTDGPYANVGALWYGRFLDPRARQLHRLHPFLPTALHVEVDGRTFHY